MSSGETATMTEPKTTQLERVTLHPEIMQGLHPMIAVAHSHSEILGIAKMLLGSGLLSKKGITTEYQAYAVMVYGYSFGWDPWAALRNCHIIQGQLGMSSAAMMGLAIQAGARFEFKESGINGNDGKRGEWCELKATRPGHPDFYVRWDDADVRAAGVMKDDSNHKKYPATMKRWRCVADACRVLCPDLLSGCVTSEELLAGPIEATVAGPTFGSRTEALEHRLSASKVEDVPEDEEPLPEEEAPETDLSEAEPWQVLRDGLAAIDPMLPAYVATMEGKELDAIPTGRMDVHMRNLTEMQGGVKVEDAYPAFRPKKTKAA